MSNSDPDDDSDTDREPADDEALDVADAVTPDAEEVDATVVAWVVAGAAVFALLSIGAPMAYHATQPASNYLSAQEPTVMAASNTDPCTFQFDVNYWVRDDTPVVVDTTLYERTEDGLTERQRWRSEGYLRGGVDVASFSHTTDEPLPEGVYQFSFTATFEAPHGLEKQYVVDSEEVAIEYVSRETANETEPVLGETGAILFREGATC